MLIRSILIAGLVLGTAGAASAETVKLSGNWQSSLGPWHGGIQMTLNIAGSKLSGTSESTNGLCVGAHSISGSQKGGKWRLVTRPGGMCKELRIYLTRQGGSWSGSYELVGPTPDKGSNTLKASN